MLLEQGAADTSDAGLKASRERSKALEKARKQIRETAAQMENFVRNDLTPTQRAAFLDLRKQLRERERLQRELKAIGEIREIKVKDLRQILRKPDLKAVDVAFAAKIEWIQAHFDSYEAVARFIGKGAKDIRKLYNEFATSAEYRETLKKKLPALTYYQITRIVFKDMAGRDVRAYGEIDARQRRILYNHLLDHQGIFQEMGIDILAEPRKFNAAEWAVISEEMRDIMPADLMTKLEGLLAKDKHGNRRFKVNQFNIEDLQTLAGIVNRLRKEGREVRQARFEARAELRKEAQEKIKKTIEAHMPKNSGRERTPGIAETRMEEEKRSWRSVWYALHNARRFFRGLEGGKDAT
jgi:hypothetical protein